MPDEECDRGSRRTHPWRKSRKEGRRGERRAAKQGVPRRIRIITIAGSGVEYWERGKLGSAKKKEKIHKFAWKEERKEEGYRKDTSNRSLKKEKKRNKKKRKTPTWPGKAVVVNRCFVGKRGRTAVQEHRKTPKKKTA